MLDAGNLICLAKQILAIDGVQSPTEERHRLEFEVFEEPRLIDDALLDYPYRFFFIELASEAFLQSPNAPGPGRMKSSSLKLMTGE
jgi:hypothetical protein